jgi:signal transduction histidine kinase
MPFVRALEARAVVTVDDIVIHRNDGGRVNIRAIARPIFGAGDVITHVVIAFADITAEVSAGEASRERDERMRGAQRLEAIGTLASGVAHDFNNAMASIRVLATLLRLREADPARVADLRRIEDSTDRAAALTRSLLTFARHGGVARVRRVSVHEVARTVIDLVRRTFDRQIEIAFEGRGDGAWIDGDAAQLEQLLMNLLVNARDAMPDGGSIEVRLGGDESSVTLEVTDTGPGVPENLRARIFEPYFTTKHAGDEPGTGLGLSTVYGIVQQHGGAIDIGDAAPHGARFLIRLPGVAAGVTDSERAAPLRHGSGRILIVEDDDLVRTSTRNLLEMLGYTVEEAADGVDAVAAFRDHAGDIDAVLLDVVMPRQGGRVTLPALRAIRDVPVVITSGVVTPDDLDAWLALGATTLLSKPYDLGALSVALADAMGA